MITKFCFFFFFFFVFLCKCYLCGLMIKLNNFSQIFIYRFLWIKTKKKYFISINIYWLKRKLREADQMLLLLVIKCRQDAVFVLTPHPQCLPSSWFMQKLTTNHGNFFDAFYFKFWGFGIFFWINIFWKILDWVFKIT